MRYIVISIIVLFICAGIALAQAQDTRTLADTLTIQAEGVYEADPDLARLTFRISAQEKEMRKAYDQAAGSMQRIVRLAEQNNVTKKDFSMGVLTVEPIYDWNDRRQRARAYRVTGSIVLLLRDFARIGALIEGSIQDGIVDFRSLTYTLEDEEAAKQKAVAQAMSRAEARARAALGNGRKLGAVRYVTVDVKQPVGIVRMENYAVSRFERNDGTMDFLSHAKKSPVPLPPGSPEKVSVNASVQCVFQLQ